MNLTLHMKVSLSAGIPRDFLFVGTALELLKEYIFTQEVTPGHACQVMLEGEEK